MIWEGEPNKVLLKDHMNMIKFCTALEDFFCPKSKDQKLVIDVVTLLTSPPYNFQFSEDCFKREVQVEDAVVKTTKFSLGGCNFCKLFCYD